jgi:hypothetical protein
MIYRHGIVNDILVEKQRVFHFIHALSYRKRGIEKGTSTTYRPCDKKKQFERDVEYITLWCHLSFGKTAPDMKDMTTSNLFPFFAFVSPL